MRIQITAPLPVVWDTAVDLEAYPDFSSHVTSIEREDGNQQTMSLGTRWKETRVYSGYQTTTYNTATEVVPGMRIRVASSFNYGNSLENTETASTLEFITIDESNSEVVEFFSFQPVGLLGDIIGCLCRPCLRRRTLIVLRDELADLKAEAERRYKIQMGKESKSEQTKNRGH